MTGENVCSICHELNDVKLALAGHAIMNRRYGDALREIVANTAVYGEHAGELAARALDPENTDAVD
jgi:hypothetical protein